MNDSSTLLAHAGAILGSCLVGAAVVVTRSVVDDIDPIGLAFLRYLQGAVVLFAVLILAGRTPPMMSRSDLGAFAVLGLLMFALFPVLFNTALQYTNASRGAVILATMPIWGALLARRFAAERLRAGQVAGMLFSFAGIAVVFAESGLGIDGGSRAVVGNLLMLATAICGGLYTVLAKPVMAREAPIKVVAWAMLIGALALLGLALASGLPSQIAEADRNTLLLVIYLGVFAGGFAFWLFGYSLIRLSPTQSLVYINLNPVVATLLGSIFLDEQLSGTFGIGFAMVVGGLLLTNVPPASTGRSRLVFRSNRSR